MRSYNLSLCEIKKKLSLTYYLNIQVHLPIFLHFFQTGTTVTVTIS